MHYSALETKKYVLKNFLSDVEITEIKKTIHNNFSVLGNANIYEPYRYPDIDWDNISVFNNKTALFIKKLDIENILVTTLSKFFELNHFVPVGSMVKDELVFNPYTLRILQPNKVDIHHHVENQAIPHYPIFFGVLNKYIEVMDQFSFVLMIQKPTSGGEIVLFKDRWEGQEKIEEQRSRLDYCDKNNIIEKEIEDKISLNEGDLLIFPAGTIWHKVNEVSGEIARITIGGFMGKTKENKNTYGFWS